MYSERPVRGCSLLFQLVLLLSLLWSLVWFVGTLVLLIVKYFSLPFPGAAFPVEVVASFLVIVVHFLGFFWGRAGNLCEQIGKIGMSLFFFFLCILGSIYFMWFQSYIMKLDVALSCVYLLINCFTLLLGIWAIYVASVQASAPFAFLETNGKVKNSKKVK